MSGNLQPSKSPVQIIFTCGLGTGTHMTVDGLSVDTCIREASSKHVMTDKDGKARHSTPAPSSTPSPSHLSYNGVNLEHLAPVSPRLSTTGTLDPPITQAVLSEIDIPQLKNDLVLRHHLNFDTKIEFRINTQGPQAEERQERAGEYWRAMATEIVDWLAYCQSLAACPSSLSLDISSLRSGARMGPQETPSRLPRLFGVLREILKHSLPSEEWPTIDARLDVEFLMQQLEHGICNFTALGDWLGNFLRRFCSPTRDCLLHTMTSAIRLGVENGEKDSIVYGLETIFELLQGMNLDATNHSIRSLRLAWVEDTIVFEQNAFLQRMADGWETTGAWIWFNDLQKANEESCSGLWIIVKAITDAVVFCHTQFPPTLCLDYNRLRTLQLDFQVLFYQAAAKKTFDQTLSSLGWTGKILQRSYAQLFLRVAVLISDQGLSNEDWETRNLVALEVVRAAYAVCSNRAIPTPDAVESAEEYLRHCYNPREPVFGALRCSLAKELKDRVKHEVFAVGHLTPVQLMRRQLPRKPGFAIRSEHEGLVHIAKRTSHIAELHWRIWGPILYEQPRHVSGRALGHTSFIEEGLHGQGSSRSCMTD